MNLMKIFSNRQEKKNSEKKIIDKREQALYRLGREQFKKLTEKGLTIPVFTF